MESGKLKTECNLYQTRIILATRLVYRQFGLMFSDLHNFLTGIRFKFFQTVLSPSHAMGTITKFDRHNVTLKTKNRDTFQQFGWNNNLECSRWNCCGVQVQLVRTKRWEWTACSNKGGKIFNKLTQCWSRNFISASGTTNILENVKQISLLTLSIII